MNNYFVVANSSKTSYIDSLLIALFYKSSHVMEILKQIPEHYKFAYLQNLILENFVNPIKNSYSIEKSIIHEIRNYSVICGWKDGCDMTECFNVMDFLNFIMTGVGYGGIECEIIKILPNELKEYERVIKYNFITASVSQDTNTKFLVDKWVNNNVLQSTSDDDTNCYHFTVLPMIIPIYLDRNNNTSHVDIHKGIKFMKNNNKIQLNTVWYIHAIICCNNNIYYTILNKDNKWSMYCGGKIPSIEEINIKDEKIAEQIQRECVLLLYVLGDEICYI